MKLLSNIQVFGLFVILGIALYGNTLMHDFALDDTIVITGNEFTKKGFSGICDQLTNDVFVGFYGEKKALVSGGRYRPLSMVVFNIQYALVGESAFLGHLTNLLAYIFNGFLLFLVLKRLLPKDEKRLYFLSFPLLASLLWLFHPIHTEVVANIKGLDEIMAFIFELATLLYVLKYLEKEKVKDLLLISLFFFLGLLSKESSITWLAVIPLAVYFFTKYSFKKQVISYLPIIAVTALWAYIRHQVVGGSITEDVADNIMNDPFLEAKASDKYATIMLTLGKYIQLLIFPHPLTFDYYPKHIPIVGWSNPKVILSCFVYAFLIAIALWGLVKKKVVSFGVSFYIITLSIASNIVFVIGAFMNERFVYVSSLGFSIILAYFILKMAKQSPKNKQMIALSLVLLFIAYGVKTFTRNFVWENNKTLALNDANISINGSKSNVMAGGVLTQEAILQKDPVVRQQMLKEGIFYLNRVITVNPDYIVALELMANAQFHLNGNTKLSMPYYYKILSINPYHQNTWQNAFRVLPQEKDLEYRINAYKTLLRYNPNKPRVYLELGRTLGREKNDLQGAQQYLETGLRIAPNNIDILSNLGTLYGLQQNYTKAIEVLTKAIQINPTVAKNYQDLGTSYFALGQEEQAKIYFDKAVQLNNAK